jgi:hypothetical protein
MRAIDYSKAKRRSDLSVVLDEFAEQTKSVLEIEFEYINQEESYKS